MVGLDDLSGTDEPSLSVGVLSAAPIDGTNPSYDGTDDLDWWYAVDRTLIDAQRQPLNQLTGSVAGKSSGLGRSGLPQPVYVGELATSSRAG